jgi:hypothetical protein
MMAVRLENSLVLCSAENLAKRKVELKAQRMDSLRAGVRGCKKAV